MLLFSEKVTSTKKIKIATYLPSVVKVDVSPKRCLSWIRRLCAGKLAERKRNKQGSTHSQCILGGKSLGRESVFAGCIITSPWRSDRRGALHTCELLSCNQGQSTPYPPIGVKQEKFHSNTSCTSFFYAKKQPPHQWRQGWVKIWLPDGEKWDLWHRIYWMSLAMGSECLCHIYISVWWNMYECPSMV